MPVPCIVDTTGEAHPVESSESADPTLLRIPIGDIYDTAAHVRAMGRVPSHLEVSLSPNLESVDPLEPYSFYDEKVTVAPDDKQLLLDGAPVAGLRPQHYYIAAYLGRHPGLFRTSQQIRSAAWTGKGPLMTPDSLRVRISELRRVLGQSAIIGKKGLGYCAHPNTPEEGSLSDDYVAKAT